MTKVKKAACTELAPLLRKRDILELLGISQATLHRWIQRGDFPPLQTLHGAIKVLRREDLVAWIDARIR